MAKVRVYELAKELGVESKTVLSMLKDMGEFVRSASSTVEAPVERRLKEKLASEPPPVKKTTAKKAAAKKADAEHGDRLPRLPAERARGGTGGDRAGRATGGSRAGSQRHPQRRSSAAGTDCPSGIVGPPPRRQPSARPPRSQRGPAAQRRPRLGQPTAVPRPSVPRAPGQAAPAARTAGDGAAAAAASGFHRRASWRSGSAPTRHPAAGQQPVRTLARNGPAAPGAARPRWRRTGRTAPACGPRSNAGQSSGRSGHAAAEPGDDAQAELWSAGQRPAGPGARGRGAPAGGRRPGAGAPGRGGPGGGPGGPPPSGRGGRGGRGGTQGAFGRAGGPTRRGRKSKKQRRQEFDQMEAPSIGGIRVKQGDGQKVRLARGASLTDLAEKIGADAASLVQVLFHLGEMVTATQSVSDDTLQVLGTELNYGIEVVSPEDEDRELLESFDIEFGENVGGEEDLEARPPVVTVMGHVDHGKTKLLDAIRKTNVVAREAGGITQAIGAYQVSTEVEDEERKITFIDTPGHEAFTAMRARGAKSTDIAVLVVAADDGVMPQTIEALNHALAAEVPVVVAVNKIDKVGADPTKVRGQLTEYGLVPEEYGGDTMFVDVSAVTGQGLDSLLEAIILTADAALDLRANPDMDAQGVAIEAHLDKGRGPVATVLVQRGTLNVGDSIVAGSGTWPGPRAARRSW